MTAGPLDTTANAHHAKLAAIVAQTAQTRDLMTIALAYQIGALDGAAFERAQLVLRQRVAEVLARMEGDG